METSYEYSQTVNTDNTILRKRWTIVQIDGEPPIKGNANLRRILPIDDYSTEDDLTQYICDKVFTDEVTADWIANYPVYIPDSTEPPSTSGSDSVLGQ